jgi:hypothetical protein
MRRRNRIRLEVQVVDNPVEARTEREALERIRSYVDKYTHEKFYIGITSGTSTPAAFKRRFQNHQPSKQHQLFTMHCLYTSASNFFIRKLEEQVIEIYIEHEMNVNKIRGSKNMKKSVISLRENSYLYLLVM